MISVDEFGNLGFVREKGIAGKNDSLIVGRNFSVGKIWEFRVRARERDCWEE
ncbi:hypothetical protein TSUD_141510 [Trifolium subterraneum]|uniref:Uncharacterized protein n=1 Tax=Trifolium subterraneum TaxID=3900 RepID=A0A2Z6NN86_TRISU|nr:hypothetical protein TSUD_141510 [Trifolium subterraneum]